MVLQPPLGLQVLLQLPRSQGWTPPHWHSSRSRSMLEGVYHTIPYHTIPYHTIPYHTQSLPLSLMLSHLTHLTLILTLYNAHHRSQRAMFLSSGPRVHSRGKGSFIRTAPDPPPSFKGDGTAQGGGGGGKSIYLGHRFDKSDLPPAPAPPTASLKVSRASGDNTPLGSIKLCPTLPVMSFAAVTPHSHTDSHTLLPTSGC